MKGFIGVREIFKNIAKIFATVRVITDRLCDKAHKQQKPEIIETK
jgi:hypothetical protein